jgi:hypothetical protein
VEIIEGNQLTVNKLPLVGTQTLEYYYTYGNLLAYLQKCDQERGAPKFLNEALFHYPDDTTVLASFEESMSLCMNGPADPDTGTAGDEAVGAAGDGTGTDGTDGTGGTGVAEITATPSP